MPPKPNRIPLIPQHRDLVASADMLLLLRREGLTVEEIRSHLAENALRFVAGGTDAGSFPIQCQVDA